MTKPTSIPDSELDSFFASAVQEVKPPRIALQIIIASLMGLFALVVIILFVAPILLAIGQAITLDNNSPVGAVGLPVADYISLTNLSLNQQGV